MSFIIIYCFWYHNNIKLIVNNICVEGKVIDQLLLLLIPVELQRLSDTTKASVFKINANENQRKPENLQNQIHGNILFTQLYTYVYYSCIHHNAFGLLFIRIHTLLRCVDFWWCCFHTVCERKSWHFEPGNVFYGLKAWKKNCVEKNNACSEFEIEGWCCHCKHCHYPPGVNYFPLQIILSHFHPR